MFTALLDSLRQLLQPAEFRIPKPVWPEEWQVLLTRAATQVDTPTTPLAEDRAAAQETTANGPTAEDRSAIQLQRTEKEQTRLLADLATNLWRLRGRMVDPTTGTARDQVRREYRHVETMWDALTQSGIEVQDHTGARFEIGMALKVLTYQPVTGLSQERVRETIKPSIYQRGKPIQVGEVIVECPEKTNPEQSSPEQAETSQERASKHTGSASSPEVLNDATTGEHSSNTEIDTQKLETISNEIITK